MRSVAWLEPFWLLALAPLLLLPGRFIPLDRQPLVWAGLALGWPLRRLAYGRFTRRTPIDLPLAFLLLWLPVNYWAAADKALALETTGYLLLGIALLYGLVNWPPATARPARVAWLLALAGLGFVLVGPLLNEQVSGRLPLPLQLSALPEALTLNANVLAGALALLSPLAAALAVGRGTSLPLRFVGALVVLAALPVIVLSGSRSGALGVAAGLVVVLILRWPRLLLLAPVALLAAGIAVYQLGPESALNVLSSNDAIGGLDGRLEIWSRAQYAMTDFAFTGIGIGNFPRVIPVLYPLFLASPDNPIPHAHNLLFQVGLDLGLPGLIAYLAILIAAFARLAGLLRRPSELSRTLAIGATAGLVALLVHGLLDAPLWGTKPAFLPWLVLALALLPPATTPPPTHPD